MGKQITQPKKLTLRGNRGAMVIELLKNNFLSGKYLCYGTSTAVKTRIVRKGIYPKDMVRCVYQANERALDAVKRQGGQGVIFIAEKKACGDRPITASDLYELDTNLMNRVAETCDKCIEDVGECEVSSSDCICVKLQYRVASDVRRRKEFSQKVGFVVI